MATAANTKDVKVEVVQSTTMPTSSKLVHILAILVSGVIALAVSAVLADGTSVIRLKDPQYLPRATHASLISAGINYRLDELLGPTYGIGLHHDQSGHSWYSMSAGSTLKEIVQNLGVPVTAAAVPYVIATDGAPLSPPPAPPRAVPVCRWPRLLCGSDVLGLVWPRVKQT